MMRLPVYLDYNATTPVDPAVADEMIPCLRERFGNPGSSHIYGRQAREAVSLARRRVAALLGSRPDEIIFTGGGTESNNLAIIGAARAMRHRGNHLIATAVEHPAVLEVFRYLESEGFRYSLAPVDGTGMADPAGVESLMQAETILVSVMHANNETGTIQPVAQIAAAARRRGIWVHCDAAQSAGKIPVDTGLLGVDLLSLAGHKLYGPKGVGALYIRDGVVLEKLIHGAGQEGNRRPGTENVASIAGLGKACELAAAMAESGHLHLKRMRDLLQALLLAGYPEAVVNGHPELRLPNTLSISFPGLPAGELLDRMPGVAASAGAACHSGGTAISGVLEAMQVPVDVAKGTLRLSTGRFTTEDEIRAAATEILEAVRLVKANK